MIHKIGLGGGCHWCTEAVFLSLKGVLSVAQGWIASDNENSSFSEAIVLEYESDVIPIDVLIAVHVHTHSATSTHSMRGKYRSAIYYFTDKDRDLALATLYSLQHEFDAPLITQVLPFMDFKLNIAEQLNYYYTDPSRPFCQTYIDPKIKMLLEKFTNNMDRDKVSF